nr:immunoglobulin light chain junction region [Macaca mulatta]
CSAGDSSLTTLF